MGGNISQLVYLTPHPLLPPSPPCRNALDDGWGATYPSWFILPPTRDFRALTGYDFVIAVNCFNNYKRICFTKYRYCLLKKSHFMKFFIYRWGATYPSWFTLPPCPLLHHHHPGHCSSFLEIMEWVFSASWVKLMKISHYQCLGWRVGGNLSQLVYLTPHPRLWSSDCVQRMKMTSSATLVKMKKIPYYLDISCMFAATSH